MSVDDLLDRVEARLSDPSRWHGEAETREGDFGSGCGLDLQNRQVDALDPSAVRHCIIGAFKVEAGVQEGMWPLPGEAGEAYDRITDAAGWGRGECFNDAEGYDVVIAAVRSARRGSLRSLTFLPSRCRVQGLGSIR